MGNKNKEQRFTNAAELRVAEVGKARMVRGYAAKYNKRSHEMTDPRTGRAFVEVIAPGAFKRILQSDPDVCCLVAHDEDRILGRTTSGTLRLSEDSTGLYFECTLPDTTYANDVYASIKRGDMDQCSFAFGLGEGDDEWREGATRNAPFLRTINNFGALADVSIVVHPAYEDTEVAARKRSAEQPITDAERIDRVARTFREIQG